MGTKFTQSRLNKEIKIPNKIPRKFVAVRKNIGEPIVGSIVTWVPHTIQSPTVIDITTSDPSQEFIILLSLEPWTLQLLN